MFVESTRVNQPKLDDAYQFTILTNPIKVLIKSIASPGTEFTKEVVLDSMFSIVWFYDIKERLLFNLNLLLF
jgi:hypothetical protein